MLIDLDQKFPGYYKSVTLNEKKNKNKKEKIKTRR